MRIAVTFVLVAFAATVTAGGDNGPEPSPEEQTLRAAGLGTDDATLLDFFRERVRTKADGEKLLTWARKLGDPNAPIRAKAAAHLLASGAPAIPALRHVLNDLDDAVAAEGAQRCLEWIEGSRRGEVPVAAARLLAKRKAAGATEALLAYLPFADDVPVVDGVKAALITLATAAEKPEPALIKALKDPVPLRRAIALEVLCSFEQPEVLPDIRRLLADPKPQVRMRAALALVERQDEEAIGVLINLLADLPPAQRKQAEEALQNLAGDWAPNPNLAGDDEVSRKIRRDAWAAWWRNTDGPALLAAFRKRTLTGDELTTVQELIVKLGDKVFATRERAAADLVILGPKVVPLLREATKSPDLERAQRAKGCLAQIAQSEDKHKLPPAAARLLALRKPPGATETLLTYLPFSDDEHMKVEISKALKYIVLASGKPDPILVKALNDAHPLRRAAAAEAIAGAGPGEHLAAIRKLLKDPDTTVRLRVAVALTYAREKDAVVALIDLIAELPRGHAWEAEELLYRLAGAKAPPGMPGDDAAGRKKFRDEWHKWWKENSGTVDLAQLKTTPLLLGYTIIAEMAQNGQNGRIVEVDRNGKVRWTIDNVGSPLDVQYLPGDRVLIAESSFNRVTERDLKGKILWQVNTNGYVTNAQRLANGNTFICNSGGPLVEVDKTGKQVSTINVVGGARAAYKMTNGQIVVLTNQSMCLRLDATGKELKRFNLIRPNNFTSGIDVTPKGNILVTQNDSMITEYDPDGKKVWEAKSMINTTTATRLINGHTLYCSYNNSSVIELDATGRTVWEYRAPPGNNAFRARQR